MNSTYTAYPNPELAQLEMLAQVDELVARLSRWGAPSSPWEPLEHCHALVRRLLSRVETLRIRLETPLVVATFGGTGTGKSTLVNALVGRECTTTGRQRPTTTQPVLIAHPELELSPLGLPLDEFQIQRVDAPLLRDVVIIDCPDPDTTEAETHGSNLARLHQLLPFCDVLIYTSTQQKYRSARVTDELAQAATGCRLVFVQTHAAVDEDIRDDWRQQLDGLYRVPDMYFVDSLRAMREQQAGQRPTGDFGRLQDLLTSQLAASHRTQIRRANLIDLVQGALTHCRQRLDRDWPGIERLESALDDQRQKLIAGMSTRLRDELLTSRNLWERRLIGAVAQQWGFSPFASVLRVYNGLGNLIASAGLWRARSSAQMALIGAVQGVRWLNEKKDELQSESRLERAAAISLDDTLLRESQVVIAGYVQEARLDPTLVETGTLDSLRREAVRVEDQFLGDAGRRTDEIIADLSSRHSGKFVHGLYELLLFVLIAYIVGFPAYNFFYAHPVLERPLVPSDFYIHGGVFFVLWSLVLVMVFTHRLRRGLVARITELAQQVAQTRLAAGLFPALEQACSDLRVEREQLEALATSTASLRREIAASHELGAPIRPVPLHMAESR